jgi:hypothetical protein
MASNFIPQVDYTSRDYAAIRDNMIALIPSFLPEWTSTDASDFGITLIELFAYMGDLMNYYIDRSANEGFIGTATQRSSVLSIAQLLGYSPSPATPALVTLTFTNSTNSDVTIPALTQVATTTTVNGISTQIIFETNGPVLVPANSSGTIDATQGQTIAYEHIGDSNGTANQVFALAQNPLISNTSSIIVGTLVGGVPTGVSYTEVPYIIDAGSNDPSYSVNTDSNNISYITFGDGVSGRIPPINGVYATYRIGGGAYGNVGPSTLTYQISNVTPGIMVNNLFAASGGADEETTDSIRVNAPVAYTALNRAVSLTDYSSLSVQVPAISKAIADSTSSYNSIVLYISPFGDNSIGTPGVDAYGNTTPTFTSAVTNLIKYLTDKAPATTTVTVNPPAYIPINISLTVYVLPQFKQSDVVAAVNQALATLFEINNVIFAENVVLQYVHSALSQVNGVDYVNISLLTRADANFTGNISSGSATITAPSSVLNLEVGDYVALAAGSTGTVTIPTGTTISSINTATATITNATVASGVVTYTASNSFTAGQPVTITGVTPNAFNISGVIATASSSQFTVANNGVFGTYTSGGTATETVSLTMSAVATGSGSTTGASLWTSGVATTGVNNLQLDTDELPTSGVFTVVASGGILA